MLNDQNKKGIYVPPYYNDFKCIADRCRHSCCIDWEICIDEDTYEKYKQIKEICDTVEEGEDGPSFVLCENGKCPHLNDAGLCKIILTRGEEYLSEICRNHPRFFNYISCERTEAGLGIVCEEACRLILEEERPFRLSKIEELDGDEFIDDGIDFDPLPQRESIFAMIEREESFDKCIGDLKSVFQLPSPYTPDEWFNRFLALEILDEAWKKDLQDRKGSFLQVNREEKSVTAQYEKYYARLLTYFVYRHVSIAYSSENLRARLAFCILSAEVIRSLFEQESAGSLGKLIDWARRYSAEIEYSVDNTEELIFAFENRLI